MINLKQVDVHSFLYLFRATFITVFLNLTAFKITQSIKNF